MTVDVKVIITFGAFFVNETVVIYIIHSKCGIISIIVIHECSVHVK